MSADHLPPSLQAYYALNGRFYVDAHETQAVRRQALPYLHLYPLEPEQDNRPLIPKKLSLDEILQLKDPLTQLEYLSLLGDPQRFAQHAYKLASIPSSAARDLVLLLLDELPYTREGLTADTQKKFYAFDPIHVQALCRTIPQTRSPERIAHLVNTCRGRAIEYFRE